MSTAQRYRCGALIVEPQAPQVPQAGGMSAAHCARKLLAHGPLAFAEFHAITGWPKRRCHKTLEYLKRIGLVRRAAGSWHISV
jgi:hypothetical protein